VTADVIASGRAVLGIELGSTRIKACLMDPDGATLATANHGWENRFIDGDVDRLHRPEPDAEESWPRLRAAARECDTPPGTRLRE
jgi:sugar (pentulose or hexulose) kinase